MPYLDKICTVNVTGEELKKAFYPSSNLKQTIQIDKYGNSHKLFKKR